jgi:hypothetical protein
MWGGKLVMKRSAEIIPILLEVKKGRNNGYDPVAAFGVLKSLSSFTLRTEKRVCDVASKIVVGNTFDPR